MDLASVLNHHPWWIVGNCMRILFGISVTIYQNIRRSYRMLTGINALNLLSRFNAAINWYSSFKKTQAPGNGVEAHDKDPVVLSISFSAMYLSVSNFLTFLIILSFLDFGRDTVNSRRFTSYPTQSKIDPNIVLCHDNGTFKICNINNKIVANNGASVYRKIQRLSSTYTIFTCIREFRDHSF